MQGNCLAIGNRLAVVAANCFVLKLERKLCSILPARPLFWIRYIDDIIAICDKTIISEDLLVTNLKDLHPNITFTYVLSSLQEGAIFLDTFISTNNNDLSIGMYRKPTDSNRVLNFNSNHTMFTKLGVAIGQFKCVQKICNNTKTLADGEEIIRETLKNSNYPVNIIHKAYSISITKKKKEKDVYIKDFVVLRLPFVNNRTTNGVKRELSKFKLDYAICPIFHTGLHLSDIFNSEQPSLYV